MACIDWHIRIDTSTGEIIIKPVGGSGMQTATTRELMDQYLTWGRAHGGNGDRPWTHFHELNVTGHLGQWRDDPNCPGMVNAITPAFVESHLDAMRALRKKCKTTDKIIPLYSPVTLRHRFTTLRSFVNWCIDRKHLTDDPMSACRKPHGTPMKKNRILTMAEFIALECVAPDYRKLVYRLAVQTALRRDEMRSLKETDLDAPNCRIRLDSGADKTRQEFWIPLTPALVTMLQVAPKTDDGSLLRLTYSPIQEFDKDCERAGISKLTDEGNIDFHGLRRTACSWFEDTGAPASLQGWFERHSVRSISMRYKKRTADEIRRYMLIVEQRLDDAKHIKVEDRGIEPLTSRLPALGGRDPSRAVPAIINAYMTLYYEMATAAEVVALERQIRVETELLLARKFGGKA